MKILKNNKVLNKRKKSYKEELRIDSVGVKSANTFKNNKGEDKVL